MRKLVLALTSVLVLASFTNSTNKTIILKDIDGTLLQSYPVIKTNDGDYTISFTVNASTVVTTSVEDGQTHINLVENGFSNKVVPHNITFKTASVDFNSYFESNFDVASAESAIVFSYIKKGKPKKLME